MAAARLDLWVGPGEKGSVPMDGVQVGTTKAGDTRAFPVVLLSVNGMAQFGHVAFLLHQSTTRCYQKMQGSGQPNYCSLPPHLLSTTMLFSHLYRGIFLQCDPGVVQWLDIF